MPRFKDSRSWNIKCQHICLCGTYCERDSYDPQSPPASNKRVLVQFLKCRRISDLIREIQMYQNQPYALQVEKSIRVRQIFD
ncbi:unnamed protein product [Nippostrongylus brasiliensis]|uniref:DUF4817 domain-containing protein n=1 Tax=Nippostrongylus brasiliensis TaxID=27835 RepID=A0A0N4YF97_NIPBR|nr:unnamed protein product [Nippostrongylus brasiliensis]